MVFEDVAEFHLAGIPSADFWVGAVDPQKFAAAQESGTPLPQLHTAAWAPDYAPTRNSNRCRNHRSTGIAAILAFRARLTLLVNLNSGRELEIRIWDEPDISISPAAFEAIAFCELLMRSVKKQLARPDSVEALGRETSPVAPSCSKTPESECELVLQLQ
jgi:hypothetical protein